MLYTLSTGFLVCLRRMLAFSKAMFLELDDGVDHIAHVSMQAYEITLLLAKPCWTCFALRLILEFEGFVAAILSIQIPGKTIGTISTHVLNHSYIIFFHPKIPHVLTSH